MAEIDMIPRSYRDGLRVRRVLRGYGATLAALALAGGGGAGLLHWRINVEAPRLDRLRAHVAQADALRTRIAAAATHKNILEQDARTLAALRGIGDIARLALALDATLNDKVWFETLRFSRTEELLHAPLPNPLPQGTLETQASGAAGAPPGPQTWRLGRHVDIGGQALNHAALTAFLTALSANPVLTEVQFLKSNSTGSDGQDPVAFSVTGSLTPAKALP